MSYEPYTSIDDINNRLKILKLKREIEKEGMKLNAHLIKKNIAPGHLIHRFGKASKIAGFRLVSTIFKKMGARGQ